MPISSLQSLAPHPFDRVRCYCWVSVVLIISAPASADDRSHLQLHDVSRQVGLRFDHVSPPTRERHVHLTMGSGVGWFDLDRDGWPDLYCGQGCAWTGSLTPPRSGPADVLFRNRQGTFVDVSGAARVHNVAYAMGVAAGDFNNDGFGDVFISSFGRNCLLCNNGDGTFNDISLSAGLEHEGFGSSCTWADIEGDGDLDLLVVNYLRIDPADYPVCFNDVEGREIHFSCHPQSMVAESDLLYRNNGDGSFDDVSDQAGLHAGEPRQGLGVVAADLEGDGDVDFYIANDTVPNQLWVNDGEGHFSDEGLLSGVALNRRGVSEAGMGIAAGDVDGNATIDLFVTNYFTETNTFYRNEGQLLFLDVTEEIGLAAPSLRRLAFGTTLFDVDNDGWLDLLVVNGHVNDRMHLMGRDDEPYAQLPQLYANRHGKHFVDVSSTAGSYFLRPSVGRSTACADFDCDGRSDVAVLHSHQPLALLRNQTVAAGRALVVELVGIRSCRDAITATLTVVVGEQRIVRIRSASGSYLGCDDGRMTIGLGDSDAADEVVVTWPSGHIERWAGLAAGPVHRLVEGTGQQVR